jgi:CDP-diacylglycerol--glycerol-3-phosphate 3-phosphatidyltransferase
MKWQPFRPKDPGCFYSVPNLLTLIRLVLSLAFFIAATTQRNPTYNFIGLAIHWLGDVLDGFCARKFKQETILGAEIDIIADRIETLFFYINFLFFRPALFLPVAIYLINFAFIDFYLSYQFLKFDLISPIYFDKVSRPVYSLNFSSLARFCNSTVVTLILIFLPQFQIIATVFACGSIVVKSYSIHLLYKIGLSSKTCLETAEH